MASITLTVPVPVNSGAYPTKIAEKIAGSAVTAGQAVYEDYTDSGRVKVANATAVATAKFAGIALTSATAAGQPIKVAYEGDLTVASALTPATAYVLSGATPGAIADHADMVTATTWYCTVIGAAISATVLRMKPVISDVLNA